MRLFRSFWRMLQGLLLRCLLMLPQKVPDTHKRLAADRPDGVQNFVYCPHASELSVSHPHRAIHVG